jgi:hypothetical protein
MILGLDPGPEKSGLVLYDHASRAIHGAWVGPNPRVRSYLRSYRGDIEDLLVVEELRARGQPCYQQVLETAIELGRAVECWQGRVERISRDEVKRHLLGTSRGSDANVRAALVDRWGGKSQAIGTRRAPGPLYGVAGDAWAALGVAVVWADKNTAAAHDLIEREMPW